MFVWLVLTYCTIMWRVPFLIGVPFYTVLKRFVVICVRVFDFLSFGHGIFFNYWILFREYTPCTTTTQICVFSKIVTFRQIITTPMLALFFFNVSCREQFASRTISWTCGQFCGLDGFVLIRMIKNHQNWP